MEARGVDERVRRSTCFYSPLVLPQAHRHCMTSSNFPADSPQKQNVLPSGTSFILSTCAAISFPHFQHSCSAFMCWDEASKDILGDAVSLKVEDMLEVLMGSHERWGFWLGTVNCNCIQLSLKQEVSALFLLASLWVEYLPVWVCRTRDNQSLPGFEPGKIHGRTSWFSLPILIYSISVVR